MSDDSSLEKRSEEEVAPIRDHFFEDDFESVQNYVAKQVAATVPSMFAAWFSMTAPLEGAVEGGQDGEQVTGEAPPAGAVR